MENAPNAPNTPEIPVGINPNPETRAQQSRFARWREGKMIKAWESSAGTSTFMWMARSAIRFAVSKEPDPAVRRRRRNILLQRWERYVKDIQLMRYRGLPWTRR